MEADKSFEDVVAQIWTL